MHRAILLQCLPCLGALAAAFVALALVAKLSGARMDWRRLLRLHRCQDGGVQSLAFVLTLPIGIMIILFIVQVSQLMIGVMVVNYAAYAAARAACVWTPMETVEAQEWGRQNVHLPLLQNGRMLLFVSERNFTIIDSIGAGSSGTTIRADSEKAYKISLAAALACVPIAPSRNLPGMDQSLLTSPGVRSAQRLYRTFVPGATARTDRWLANKMAYAIENTAVWISYDDKDSDTGPTYNPDGLGYQRRTNEIGWQDPITLTVVHNFALLPGPGKFLAQKLVRGPDTVSQRIESASSKLYDVPVRSVVISASVTFTNEGLKSVIPHVHRTY